MFEPTSQAFPANVDKALDDADLQRALRNFKAGFQDKRQDAIERLPEFDALRDEAVRIKNHALGHLDLYLEAFERKVLERGGHVHWARDAAEAQRIVVDLCKGASARTVTKSKSMIAEEIDLNARLEAEGITPVETDLGEYIIQLAGERPSHLVGPAVHMTKSRIADLFAQHHEDPRTEEADALLGQARRALRRRYLEADVGITGANMLIAETGSVITVTNEGNAELTQGLPRTHVVIASLEKVVPTFEDACTLLRLLARSATGQDFSSYTTMLTGPKRADDLDGPENFHVVLLDNGRSRMIGTDFQDMLRCIRCGACMNHCPVYLAAGGHAYGWVYVGPMGAVLTPQFIGIEKGHHLPNASTFCGRCEEVCPVRIPLPRMMRLWREEAFKKKLMPSVARRGLGFWAFAARRPRLYRFGTRLAIGMLALFGRRRGRFSKLPFAGGWTVSRDLPAPEGGTFMARWQKTRGREAAS